jgi:excisionase family DNA binding protein
MEPWIGSIPGHGGAMIGLEQGKYVSTGQAARLLMVSRERVAQMIASGRLPALPTPLGRLVERRAVEVLVAEQAARETRG